MKREILLLVYIYLLVVMKRKMRVVKVAKGRRMWKKKQLGGVSTHKDEERERIQEGRRMW